MTEQGYPSFRNNFAGWTNDTYDRNTAWSGDTAPNSPRPPPVPSRPPRFYAPTPQSYDHYYAQSTDPSRLESGLETEEPAYTSMPSFVMPDDPPSRAPSRRTSGPRASPAYFWNIAPQVPEPIHLHTPLPNIVTEPGSTSAAPSLYNHARASVQTHGSVTSRSMRHWVDGGTGGTWVQYITIAGLLTLTGTLGVGIAFAAHAAGHR